MLVDDPAGFAGICAAPCLSVAKSVEVFEPGNPAAPGSCATDEHTYVYRLANLTSPPGAATLPFPGVPVTGFEIAADASRVGAVGWLDAPGVAPVDVVASPLNVVGWTFPGADRCPACLRQGDGSAPLYVCSSAPPRPASAALTAVSLGVRSECLAPAAPAARRAACDDGLDNDGDGRIDFGEDPGCVHPFGIEDPQCDDGLDNDADGRVDWSGAGAAGPDPDCAGPTDNLEAEGCGPGFGAALAAPALAWGRRRAFAAPGRRRAARRRL